MPVNVDSVYQTVQALANKEQRGYLTPQEFNLFANQAQQDMFEQYFYDLGAFTRAGEKTREIGDSVTHLQHKLRNTSGVTIAFTACTHSGAGTWLLPNKALTGKIFYTESGLRRELKALPGDVETITKLSKSRWHAKGGESWYFEDGISSNGDRIQAHKTGVFGSTLTTPITTGITCETVLGKPGLVYWGYIVVNEKPVYDPTQSSNFGLHVSEQTDLVITILKLAGISIEDSQLYQAAAGEEQQNMQQENK
ncbi:MAG: hypothetical protein CMI60_20575 [Parvibaculum sp.]|nr:hypothetical protein [Parvibaculum sp.]